jgi:hypothetical protein
MYILYKVNHVIFSFGTREEITIAHMVVRIVLSDIACQHGIHMVKGDKERFTKLISISMRKLLIVRG